ncbi:MAG: HAD-IC family P-type ATPase [Candidatus Methanofastidiosa archaeon]|nr:HAD-IC family P-type ATPase [Candidatus Methanofastidiosa archaeon]
METKLDWCELNTKETIKKLDSSTGGLSSKEAFSRLEKYGYNEIKFKKKSPLVRFLMQFNNPLLIVLIVAAFACFFLWAFMGEEDIIMDMWVIIGVVLATAIIGFIQEGKAEASIDALKDMLVDKCKVIRDGETKVIPARELVPGDVVIIESGDKVPADLRITSSKSLHLDESMLTGESMPVNKGAEDDPNKKDDERKFCMAYGGTFVTSGRGHGIAYATAEDTEIGKIAKLMKSSGQTTPPILKKISAFVKLLIITIVSFGVLVFGLGVIEGYEIVYMFLAMIGMIVALIPEGLAGAIIAAFAVGSTAMARRNAIVRNLPAAETLGSVTVICSDKTGTLTKNEMTAVRIFSGNKFYFVEGVGYEPIGQILEKDKNTKAKLTPELIQTLRAGFLCNNAGIAIEKDRYVAKGSHTEAALIVSATKAGVDEKLLKLDEIPFDPKQQYMATLHEEGDTNLIYVKGSPERILKSCKDQLVDGKKIPLDKDLIMRNVESMAKDALRVLAMAYKKVPTDKLSLEEIDISDLTFVGAQGMIDPPRKEAIDAIEKCKTAGIRPVMITGDHAFTAKAVAKQLKIGDGEDSVLTGKEISDMTDEELYKVVNDVSVYARVEPEHKYRITKQLQERGHIVAMTGDGVNDAPALKAADIGVAMGKGGTEVSKEASDIILTDDNFATIVDAVEEGRHVYDNIWKVILYIMPTNGGQGLAMAGALFLAPLVPLFSHRLPIEPVQILWVNLIIAIACAIPLIWEPAGKDLLNRPPRDPNEKLFNKFFIRRVGIVSIIEVAMIFSMYLLFFDSVGNSLEYMPQAQTIAFTTIIMIEVGYLFTARSLKGTAFKINPFRNKWLIIGAMTTLVLQVILVYSEPLFGTSPFRTAPFPAIWWIPLTLVATTSFFVIEIEKFIARRLEIKKTAI